LKGLAVKSDPAVFALALMATDDRCVEDQTGMVSAGFF
jgi:hypothetical protein